MRCCRAIGRISDWSNGVVSKPVVSQASVVRQGLQGIRFQEGFGLVSEVRVGIGLKIAEEGEL